VSVSFSVVVPSFGRPRSLAVCLGALAAQSRTPEETIVVVRAGDDATRALLAEFPSGEAIGLREQVVEQPGQVAALAAGSASAVNEVVAITDDDAAPRPEWLERLEDWFADPAVTAVGGRDFLTFAADDPRTDDVGRMRWYGRLSGNHHLGEGPPRDVDVLKGVNMAFRRGALLECGFDPRLRGNGAQVHNDMMVCLCLRRRGARLVYDPELVVDHMPAERPAGDDRTRASVQQHADAVHNETLAILEYLPSRRRPLFLGWAVLIGRAPGPGFVHTLLRGRPGDGWADRRRRLVATLRGRWLGWRTFRGAPPERAC
jgi:GT2 family glycosyltransferase